MKMMKDEKELTMGAELFRVKEPKAQSRKAMFSKVNASLVIVLAVMVVFPFFWMVRSSFMSNLEIHQYPPLFLPKNWRFDNYSYTLTVFPFGRYFLNTLTIAIPSMFGVLLTSSLAAYTFARRGRRAQGNRPSGAVRRYRGAAKGDDSGEGIRSRSGALWDSVLCRRRHGVLRKARGHVAHGPAPGRRRQVGCHVFGRSSAFAGVWPVRRESA